MKILVCFVDFLRPGCKRIRFRVTRLENGRFTFCDRRGRDTGTLGTTGLWGTRPPLPANGTRSLTPTAFKIEAARYVGTDRADEIVQQIMKVTFFFESSLTVVRDMRFSTKKERIMFLRHFLSPKRRRRRLAKKVDRLERLETRNTITEPINVTSLAVTALRGAAQLGFILPNQASNALSGLVRPADVAKQAGRRAKDPIVVNRDLLKPIPEIGAAPRRRAGGGSSTAGSGTAKNATKHASNDWLNLNTAPAANASDAHGISSPWQPAKAPGGGAALPPRGGSSASGPARASTRGAITPLRLPASTPAASNAGGSSAALLAAVAGASSAGTAAASAGTGGAARRPPFPWSTPHREARRARAASRDKAPGGITFSADGVSWRRRSGGTPISSIPDPVIGNSRRASLQQLSLFPNVCAG